MENVFLHLVNMSITAGWIALAVIILRLFLRKAPKWITVLLWGLVGIRLVLPISIESILSLIPSAETIPPEIIYAQTPQINSGVDIVNSAVNPVISESLAPSSELTSINPVQVLLAVASVVWIAGMAGMLIYTLISYLRLRHKVRVSMSIEKNTYICDDISTPFILGFIKPKIYLPSNLTASEQEYVLAHEKAHIKRRDHLIKPIGFLLLSIYWFNPLLWVAYVLLCRDIELACDEKVIRDMGVENRKEYSTALLNCSVPRRMITACPLAFGEVGVKQRIKSVLNYKKPAFWISIVAIVLCIALSVCFLTNPIDSNPYGVKVVDSGSDIEGVSLELLKLDLEEDAENEAFIEIKWKNKNNESYTCGEEFYIYKYIDGGWVNLRRGDYTFYSIGYSIPANGSFTHEYGLWNIEIDEVGTYRFESTYLRDKGDTYPTRYKAWVDFEVTKLPDFDYSSEALNTIGSSADTVGIGGEVKKLTQTAEVGHDYLDDNSTLQVTWSNTKGDPVYTQKETFSIYKKANGEWVDHSVAQPFYYSTTEVTIPAVKGYATIDYPLIGVSYLTAGTYRLETHFYTDYGEDLTAYIEFTVGAASYESFEAEDVAKFYCYEAQETFKPQITLYRRTREFTFTLSGLSSYVPTGKYSTEGNILTLTADDGNKYVFEVVNSDSLKFIASESAELPKYRYAQDEEARYPFEDGAVFSHKADDGTSIIIDGKESYYNYTIAETSADIDFDGKAENIVIHPGKTSGIFSFIIEASENGALEYFAEYSGPVYDFSFEKDSEGTVYLKGVGQDDNSEAHRFDLKIKGEQIILTENGLPYGYIYTDESCEEIAQIISRYIEGYKTHDVEMLNSCFKDEFINAEDTEATEALLNTVEDCTLEYVSFDEISDTRVLATVTYEIIYSEDYIPVGNRQTGYNLIICQFVFEKPEDEFLISEMKAEFVEYY